MEDAKRRLFDRLWTEIRDKRVVEAMERVRREEFVPEGVRQLAYEDAPAPIRDGQTISQPYIVAMMLSALELRRTDRALELGTGSGYQAAILAELAAEVVSVERIPSLAESARKRLAFLGYTTVEVVMAEHRLGWPKAAPYDGIVVAAGAPRLPRELMDQMAIGGRLVVPVGSKHSQAIGGRLVVPVGSKHSQDLMKVRRSEESYSVETLGPCRFVPLIGEGAWAEGLDDA